MSLEVTKLARPPRIDGSWDKSQWEAIQPELIGEFMGEKPAHFPKTQVKLAYDETALYAIFRVEDRYVRAVASENQGNVCRDSCVEFFFTPGDDVSAGYFNLEMNCGGTMLFHCQKKGPQGRVVIPESDCIRIEVAHSLPKIIDPEIEEPVTWTVEYGIPMSILEQYSRVTGPASGVTWRGNLYKCGDRTSHPHWLTWSVVDFPKPNFHLPEFFGELVFA